MRKISRSPMRRHLLNPLKLKQPEPQYDLAKTLKAGDNVDAFETVAKVRIEDTLRIASLRRGSAAASMAASWLEENSGHRLPVSLVSAECFRVYRRRILGGIHRAFHQAGFQDDKIYVFTIIHPGWTLASLHRDVAMRTKAKFERFLERAGVTKASGLLFAGLHGEFNGTCWVLHFHGIVAGDKVKLLKAMAGKFGLVPVEVFTRRLVVKINKPLRVSRLQDPPRQISYCLQAWWPTRTLFRNAKGKLKRPRTKQRLKEPQQCEWLTWATQQSIREFMILNGLKFRNGTFVPT